MPETPKFKFFRDSQNIIAVGVTIISLCALIVSVIQTSILREEQELIREYSRASVWPRLTLSFAKGHNEHDNSVNKLALELSNDGVGPAIITDVKVTYNDTVANNWWHLFKIQKTPDSIPRFINNRSFNKEIIKIGETLEIMNLDHNILLGNVFLTRLEGLHIEIYYESIYGEKWKNKWKYNMNTTSKLENFEGLPDAEQFR